MAGMPLKTLITYSIYWIFLWRVWKMMVLWLIGISPILTISGPMQPNELIGPPTAAGPKIDGAQEQKHQPNLISILGAHRALQPNKLAEAQESSTFYTQSPVSVLKSSGSYSASIPIPRRARSRRPKQIGRNPWLSVSSRFISSSKWASIPLKDEIEKKSLDEGEKSMPWAPPSWPTPIAKKCMHCEVTKTPQWREGPLGPKTLCNACGVRYRSGRLFPEYRPAASLTFVPTLHSNSHQKVIEMRRS